MKKTKLNNVSAHHAIKKITCRKIRLISATFSRFGDSLSSYSTKPTKQPNIGINQPRSQSIINPEIQKWFQISETKASGKITAKELQEAFEVFQGKHFSDGACKFVVRLFDLDKNGGLDVKEFEQLYMCVKQWVNAFNAYDRERTGFLEESELDQALKQMDIHFSPEFIRFLITRSDPNARKMSLDQFIVTCIQIQKFSEEFKARDGKDAGSITVRYEDFLELILR